MSILILNRGPLARRPYAEWLRGTPLPLVLLASAASLKKTGEPLPEPGGSYVHTESVAGYEEGTELYERALELHQKYRFRYVVASQERDLELAGRLRDTLGLTGQSEDSALAFRDKLVMKRHAVRGGIPVAPHRSVDEPGQLRDFATEQGLPVVVKPRDSAGSVGVRVLRTQDDVEGFIADSRAWKLSSGQRGVIAEGFVEGTMYHVDGIVLDGHVAAAWPSVYHFRPAEFAVDSGPCVDVALDHDDPMNKRVMDFTEDVIHALPTPRHTTFHAEVFHTPDDRLVLCEIASRNGGGLISVVLRTMFGVHLPEAWVRADCELPVPLPRGGERLRPGRLAGEVVFLKRRGLVRAIPDRAPFGWVTGYETSLRPGMWSPGPKSSGDFMAAIVAHGDSRAQVEERLRRASDWFLDALDLDTAADGPERSLR
ncbi:ATP-grasp domain-containing protein [Streptomyces sp. NPDC048384]|uniref:ATP-grasp domain-containing protein n=1 Tax=Streptomyces sp. NPDC048384 TaxID=3155487 RepID=UPI0034499950